MKHPEEVKLEFTREWVRKAECDYQTAILLLDSGERFASALTFHAQQSVEKYIKAFLVWHQIEFKKTHDIALLLKTAAEAAPDIEEKLTEAHELTPYGVEYRYPGDYPDVTFMDAQRAVNLANLVRTEIRHRLPHEALE